MDQHLAAFEQAWLLRNPSATPESGDAFGRCVKA
jgi:hypothetical protein